MSTKLGVKRKHWHLHKTSRDIVWLQKRNLRSETWRLKKERNNSRRIETFLKVFHAILQEWYACNINSVDMNVTHCICIIVYQTEGLWNKENNVVNLSVSRNQLNQRSSITFVYMHVDVLSYFCPICVIYTSCKFCDCSLTIRDVFLEYSDTSPNDIYLVLLKIPLKTLSLKQNGYLTIKFNQCLQTFEHRGIVLCITMEG